MWTHPLCIALSPVRTKVAYFLEIIIHIFIAKRNANNNFALPPIVIVAGRLQHFYKWCKKMNCHQSWNAKMNNMRNAPIAVLHSTCVYIYVANTWTIFELLKIQLQFKSKHSNNIHATSISFTQSLVSCGSSLLISQSVRRYLSLYFSSVYSNWKRLKSV